MKKLAGADRFQTLFQSLHRLSLQGMNYGNVTDIRKSGELHVLRLLQDRFRDRSHVTIFDVGGNLGEYSIALAHYFPQATIYAFEPSLKTFEKLKENTKELKTVQPYNLGFSDKVERSTLYMDHELSTLASIYPRNLHHYHIEVEQTEEIALTTVDAFCRDNEIKKIDFLKLDVEGNELKILKGAEELIESNKVEFIQFEFGGCNIDSRTFFQDFYYLLIGQYRLFRIVKDGLVEIRKYDEANEIFRTINYFAQRR